MSNFKFPTEQVELPSKGLVYPEDNPLSSGYIEMKYMTAKEEDILTNQNYINDGTVIDKLLKSLIISKVNYDDLVVGDRNAIMIAARVLGYGKDYSFTYAGEEHTVDLTKVESRYLSEDSLIKRGENKFQYILPTSQNIIIYKLLDGKDEQSIREDIKGIQKIDKKASPELTTRLKHMILSVNGDDAQSFINEFVDNYLLARDAKALREYISKTQPDIDLTWNVEVNGVEEEATIPITINFFWPNT